MGVVPGLEGVDAGVGLVGRLLARAARAGDTVVPAAVLRSGLAASDVADPAGAVAAACAAGAAVAWDEGEPGAGAVGRVDLAVAEDTVAEEVERLLLTAEPGGPPGVTVVLGCCEASRRREVEALGRPPGLVVHERAHRLDAAAAAALLGQVPDGARLVLAGDVETLPAPGPGDVLRDLARCGALVVREGSCPLPAAVATPDDLAHLVRAGALPVPDPPDRAVVAVPAVDDAQCVRRVVQLVGESVPRAFGVAPADVLVLAPLRRGPAGTLAVGAALGGRATVLTVAEGADRRADAVVVVLPGSAAGALSRPLVHAAAATAARHLSVVTSAGAALPAAVAGVPRRGRATRLAALLADGG